ncbi:MAG: hypothetical protein Q8J69_01060 [Sphingobacteriaceae bacterium]|nr:hypothetical protein [Sphingobacteriaceae bacterium]
MKKLLLFLLASIALLSSPERACAQNSPDNSKQLYIVIKSNGTEYIGYLLQDDGREVLIETEKLGKVYIPKADIKEMRPIIKEKDLLENEFKPNNPFSTRYSFTTNALPINKGENYYMLNLYGPEFHFAVSNRLNIGVMSTWIGSPIGLAVKYTIPTENEKINYSVGSILATSGYIRNFSRFGGLHFANVTFGDRDKNLTVGGGILHWQGGTTSLALPGTYNYAYLTPSYENIKNPIFAGPMFSLAGFVRIGKRASFVFDSMLGSFKRDVPTNRYQNEYNRNTGFSTTVITRRIEKRETLAFFMMPGMRVNSTENSAFQFSLAGVSVRQVTDGAVEAFSFPMPLCSWFYTF